VISDHGLAVQEAQAQGATGRNGRHGAGGCCAWWWIASWQADVHAPPSTAFKCVCALLTAVCAGMRKDLVLHGYKACTDCLHVIGGVQNDCTRLKTVSNVCSSGTGSITCCQQIFCPFLVRMLITCWQQTFCPTLVRMLITCWQQTFCLTLMRMLITCWQQTFRPTLMRMLITCWQQTFCPTLMRMLITCWQQTLCPTLVRASVQVQHGSSTDASWIILCTQCPSTKLCGTQHPQHDIMAHSTHQHDCVRLQLVSNAQHRYEELWLGLVVAQASRVVPAGT